MDFSRIPQRPGHVVPERDVEAICDVGEEGRRIIDQTGFSSQSSYNPRRGRRVANILNDMFERDHFQGKRIVELGPGHYGFAMLARHLGAEVVCIERDPAFVELGRHLGFDVVDQDFNALTPTQFEVPFDGMFVKGTFNACGPREDAGLAAFVERVTALLGPDAWAWFVTVNKTTNAPAGWQRPEDFVRHRVEVQRQAFATHGWDVSMMIADEDRRHYALNYANSLYLFTRNLDIAGAVTAPAAAVATAPATTTQPAAAFRPAEGPVRFNRVSKPNRPTVEYHGRSWRYFVEAMGVLKARGAAFITMSDAYAGRYDPERINILIDHHIDYYPVETEVACRWEAENDIVSSVYLFARSPGNPYGQPHTWTVQDLNIPFYQELERAGFEIGYHSNAVGQARQEIDGAPPLYAKEISDDIRARAQEIFAADVAALRQHFDVRTFIPHGGGEGNVLLTDIPASCRDVIWAYNGRKKGQDDGPVWKNFSDSNSFYAQRTRCAGASYIKRIDNLHVFAHLAEPGLNHLVLHCGRYADGMPYELYRGPTPLAGSVVTAPYAFERDVELPLSARRLMGADAGPEVRSDKYYLMTDDEAVLQRHMASADLVMPTFLHHRQITDEERTRFRVPRGTPNRKFALPQAGAAFVDAYRSFINLAFTPRVLAHLAKGSYPLDACDLRHIRSDRPRDADALATIAARIPPMGRVRLKVAVADSTLGRWRVRAEAAVSGIDGVLITQDDAQLETYEGRLGVAVVPAGAA